MTDEAYLAKKLTLHDDMMKQEALDEFVERLRAGLGDWITGIHLYGSMAKGTADASSDIDVLIVYKEIGRTKLLDKVSDIAFDIACKYGELIEPVVLPDHEFKKLVGRSPFLWEVLEGGRTIFAAEPSPSPRGSPEPVCTAP